MIPPDREERRAWDRIGLSPMPLRSRARPWPSTPEAVDGPHLHVCQLETKDVEVLGDPVG